MRINQDDLKARLNLVWVLNEEGRYRAALALIAEALAMDETGEFSKALLQKQNEILARLDQRRQQKFLLMANRVSKKTTDGTDGK